MITLSTAENALKSYYLGVVSNQLNNNVNPFLAKVKHTTQDVWGKDIRKMAPFGYNGGISAGTETGNLPEAASNQYVQFVATLKNLYGKIEISDKAIRASENNAGAFVNLLNAEMEGLVKSASANLGRMLFGFGDGVLAEVTAVSGNTITVTKLNGIVEGMVIDVVDANDVVRVAASGKRITSINRSTKVITLNTAPTGTVAGDFITVQGSLWNELTGLTSIFASSGTLYGVPKATNSWMVGHTNSATVNITEAAIQKEIDEVEETFGSNIDFLLCSSGVKRAFMAHLATYKRNTDILNLEGGAKAISFNGIPLVSDRFCQEKTLYVLNSKDFHLHQLCDWKWLESEDGKVLKQVANKPVYTATLVKYAELMCDHPAGQGRFSNLTES